MVKVGKGRVQFSMRVNIDNYTFESWAKKCQKLEENTSNKIKDITTDIRLELLT